VKLAATAEEITFLAGLYLTSSAAATQPESACEQEP